jgi:cyclopropane fatty-acyl-phospholipid synthase-like methyltransferase
MNYNQRIVQYYNSSQWLYRIFCRNQFHHGFWNKNTHSLYQAALNENQAIIDLAKIKKNDRVLDAGCGVGSTANYIAEKTGARVTGISLTPNQIKLAKKHPLTNFQVQDYTKTNFSDNYFDVVYGIESICYASPKSAFLKEAYRILKPGGKLIIADGYLSRLPVTLTEKKLLAGFQTSFSVKKIITYKQMEKEIKSAGFKKLQAFPKLKEVTPTIIYFNRLFKRFHFFLKIFYKLPGIKNNFIALHNEKKLNKSGLATYYLFLAEK